ncbi:hypothetical protein LTR78_008827 [Recurvomyces mirabilis]|uniref:Serine aminopeptidase S33 domain-containing protein n=1 Tax=Recurvomyces mirabilis TaxID=574656 RepID=A0AAE0WIW0_9PEZI|nr:hypothetical protein LTR78_008827 [Recurvomyces mirabilis]KAK5160937.1 hypothetical protein LTS14_000730 [Recurvomyces mirabilis]
MWTPYTSAALFCAFSSHAAGCPPDPYNGTAADGTVALTQPYYPTTADCVEYNILVSVSYERAIFNFTHWEDNYALEQFFADVTTRPSAGFPGIVSGTELTQANYTIAASFCTPKKPNGKEKNVILATHGIGPAREHWNSSYQPKEYSFVQYAVEKGFSVFFYDRVGCGDSSVESGYVTQLNTHIAVLQELSKVVRSGQYTGAVGQPSKVILQGFSFGSYIVHNAIAATPEIADAVVLTAIGLNLTLGINANGLVRSFVNRIASLQNPQRFGELDTGYWSWVDKYALAENYFRYPYYDPGAVDFVESTKAPYSVAEFLTFPTVADASNFTGAALAITAETDYIVCDGYCPGVFDEPGRTYYKNAKPFVPYLHPDCSHHLNFHHNATGAFGVITDFLAENVF